MTLTIEELQVENDDLKVKNIDLREKVKNLEAVNLAVEGIVHHVETHDSTPEDLRAAVVTLQVKRALIDVV